MNDLKEEFKKQLHEQYAINNNKQMKNFIYFIATIVTLLSTFGYVFANTQECCRINECPKISSFSGNDLFLLGIFELIMVCFLIVLCLIIGYGQRRDKLVIDKYRDECGLESYNNECKSYWTFIPDYYNAFFVLFLIIHWLIGVALALKYYLLWPCWCPCPKILGLTKIIWIATIFIPWLIRCHYYCKYIKILQTNKLIKL